MTVEQLIRILKKISNDKIVVLETPDGLWEQIGYVLEDKAKVKIALGQKKDNEQLR